MWEVSEILKGGNSEDKRCSTAVDNKKGKKSRLKGRAPGREGGSFVGKCVHIRDINITYIEHVEPNQQEPKRV